jgi:hypothetical protein
MRPNTLPVRIGGAGLAALAVAAASLVAVRAQQAPAPAVRPMIPAAASSVASHPDDFYGSNVSLMAAVETVLSKTAFTVDQDKTRTTGKEILVFAPTMSGIVVANAYVSIIGEVFRFDAAELAKRAKSYTVDVPADVLAKFQGRPAIVATSVVNSALIDVAKRVPPPMTPAEAGYDKVMKQVGTTFTAFRNGLEAPDAAQAKEQVAILKKSFAEAEAFWKARGTADATGWAADALKLVTSMEQAVAGAKWDDVKSSATNLQQLCQTCHTAHRERLDDGTFRIKGESR